MYKLLPLILASCVSDSPVATTTQAGEVTPLRQKAVMTSDNDLIDIGREFPIGTCNQEAGGCPPGTICNIHSVCANPDQQDNHFDPGPVQMTSTMSNEILQVNSQACGAGNAMNRYSRTIFIGDDFPNGMLVSAVRIGVELAWEQRVTVRLRTTVGLIDETQYQLPELLEPSVIAVPASGLVSGHVTVDLETSGLLYIGTNQGGEQSPTRLTAPACGVSEPTPLADLTDRPMHWVVSLVGERL